MVDEKDNYRLYMENADEALATAQLNFDNGFYRSACNRAYYAMFYAASALLYSGNPTENIARLLQLFANIL